METRLTYPVTYTLPDAILVAGNAGLEGASDDMVRDGIPLKRIGVLRADGSPEPLAHCFFRNRRISPHANALTSDKLPRLKGNTIFGGVVGPQFGHIVTQSLGRLWLADHDPLARIVFLGAATGFATLPTFFLDLLRSFGVTNPVVLVTSPVVCDRLLIGPDQCNLETRPALTPFFREWQALRRPAPSLPTEPLSLYVSRTGLDLEKGQYLQECLLECGLQANGYMTFRPERASMSEQIATYLRASRLVFADGSAAHLWSLFARPDAKAAVVLRRPLDRHFRNWFRSASCPRPELLDFGMADIFRRGEGGRRSVGVIDMESLWRTLRELGFHTDQSDIGTPTSSMEGWLAGLDNYKGHIPPPPFPIDPRSQALLSLRTRVTLRHRPLGQDA